MLIPAFIFVMQQDPDHQLHPYLLSFHLPVGAPDRLFPIYLHRLILRFGTTSLERCLVLSPCKRIKPVIYCTSIRQRERSCFRQLIVRPTWFRSPQPSLRMLTYHLILLSNPVNPKCDDALSECKDTHFFIIPYVFPKKVVLLHNILHIDVFYYINNMYAYLWNDYLPS